MFLCKILIRQLNVVECLKFLFMCITWVHLLIPLSTVDSRRSLKVQCAGFSCIQRWRRRLQPTDHPSLRPPLRWPETRRCNMLCRYKEFILMWQRHDSLFSGDFTLKETQSWTLYSISANRSWSYCMLFSSTSLFCALQAAELFGIAAQEWLIILYNKLWLQHYVLLLWASQGDTSAA